MKRQAGTEQSGKSGTVVSQGAAVLIGSD
jgi:hypothetical protein